ncbi:MAG: hypothetical protein KAU50_10625, partial [Candidatus Marinimicrobia bacterium]|nr:hypothetical protein [Candidatus Neomarinimicrobiota bacterium]
TYRQVIITLSSLSIVLISSCDMLEEDTQAPDISIASPAAGSTVSDTVIISVVVADDNGVDKVEFYVDDTLLVTDIEEPFQVSWNTNDVANGFHTLLCKAYDDAGNEGLSDPVVVNVANASILASVTFEDDWLCPSCADGILAYHDMDGVLLWSDSWSGNAILEVLSTTELPSLPERTHVTMVWEPDETGQRINIDTNIGIIAGNWLRKGLPRFEYEGDITLNMLNTPEHQGFLVSTIYSGIRSRSGIIPEQMDQAVYSAPADVYIRLNTVADGPKYLMLHDAMPGDTLAVDFTGLQPLASATVALPAYGVSQYFSLDGFDAADPLGFYGGSYRLASNYPDPTAGSNEVYYPSGIFSGYRSTIFMDEDRSITDNYWNAWEIGAAPASSLALIDADFTFVSTAYDNFEVAATGTYTQINSAWVYDDGLGHEYYWRVFSDLEQYALPDLPPEFVTMYPGVTKDMFTLQSAAVQDHAGLSYDDWISLFFEGGTQYYLQIDHGSYRSREAPGLSLTSLQKNITHPVEDDELIFTKSDWTQ